MNQYTNINSQLEALKLKDIETYFYENDRLQKIVIRQFDRNDIEQDTLQHSFDYKPNGELKFIILSTELYSETIYQET